MMEIFQRLLTVKRLVTLALTLVFSTLSLRGAVSQEFMTIYTVVIAFYFGTQAAEKNDGERMKLCGCIDKF